MHAQVISIHAQVISIVVRSNVIIKAVKQFAKKKFAARMEYKQGETLWSVMRPYGKLPELGPMGYWEDFELPQDSYAQ